MGLDAAADRTADADVGQIAQKHRCAINCLDHHPIEIGDTGGEAHRTDDKLFRIPLEKLSTNIEVVGADRSNDIGQRNVIPEQRSGFHHHLKLLFPAADTEHLGDTGDRLKLVLDQPILDCP